MQLTIDYSVMKGPFLKDRTAVILGGGTIGAAVSKIFGELGAKVAGLVQTDADAGSMIDACVKSHGKIDILVNCPPLHAGKPFLESGETDWREIIDSSFLSVLAAARAALPHMIQRGYGRIVNVGSVAGKMGLEPYRAQVCGVASAVHGLTRVWAREFAGKGVAVNTVSPGIMQDDVNRTPGLAKYLEWAPMNRVCEPREIAEAVAFLAAEQAEFFTGACLDVNGGLYLD